MADRVVGLGHRKRKRRRGHNKPPLNARVVLNDQLKGDVGTISEDLFQELFPAFGQGTRSSCSRLRALTDGCIVDQLNKPIPSEVHYIAISLRAPSARIEDINWRVVPVTPSSTLANSTIQFSLFSLSLQGFADELRQITPSFLSHSRSGIEISVLDVLPISLETVYVTIETELAKRLENGEGTFHGERPWGSDIKSKGTTGMTPEVRLTSAIREALGTLKVVRSGDVFALPLPPHPITHVLPSPAKVTLCEPVAQGVLSPSTRIIVSRSHHHLRSSRATSIPLNRNTHGLGEADEDTANEQFYSAAEDRYKTDEPIEGEESLTETEAEASEPGNDDLSDSMDDIISLQVPMLPASNISGISTMETGTLRANSRSNGITTPGSVFSNFSSTTVRASNQCGHVFRAQGLMGPVPEELLRPPPGQGDDEETRVYVDITSFTKIGCFSGDWVRLEIAPEPHSAEMGLSDLTLECEQSMWRPVKIYSIPEGYSHRPITKILRKSPQGRKMSFFESKVPKSMNQTAYLSPILLANLNNPRYLRLSSLRRSQEFWKSSGSKIKGSSQPPFAKEVTLLRIATPLSTERALEAATITGVKKYFARRTRVLKNGDLVAIPVDETLGRMLYQPSNREEVFAEYEIDEERVSRITGVVWFKVGHVSVANTETTKPLDDEDVWGGVSSIDASATHMVQAGSDKRRLPAAMESTWQYYLKLREFPKSGYDSLKCLLPEPRPENITPLRRQLRELIAAATSPRAIHLNLQPLAILLVSTQRNIGKTTMAKRSCDDIGLHSFVIDAYDVLSEGDSRGSDVKAEAYLKARSERAMSCGPEHCALVIRHVDALTTDRMYSAMKDILLEARVLIATASEVGKIPDGFRGLFTHELEMSAPDEEEREGILRGIIDDYGVALAPNMDLRSVAVKTAALVAGDLVDVVDRALVAKQYRHEQLASESSTDEAFVTVRDVQVAGESLGGSLTKMDFDIAVDAARKNFADAIGAPKIPNVSWDDVGGLSNVKDAVMETIQLPLERPELFAKGMKKRSGILFYGPPGTGKTLLAKAIATEFSLNFFSVKGPELLNMYIGESEANVRRVFQRARDARPCVVFFDELDSVAPKRGNQGDSGGVMDRIVSQLLAELDGMSNGDDGGGGVFVIGATNRPDLLDAALLRPGRFDKMLYLGVSDTHEKQVTIMEALTRKYVQT